MPHTNEVFIATIEVRTGEERYTTHRLITGAKNEQEAEEKVVNHFAEFCRRDKFSTHTFFDPKGYPIYSLEGVNPVQTVSDLSRIISQI
jgi:hypothetical protein